MDVLLLEDIEVFAPYARSFVTAEPFTANVLGVEVEAVLAGIRPAKPGSLFIAVVDDAGDTIGAAMQTPPFNLFLPRLRSEVVEAVAAALSEVGRDLPGANGETGTIGAFCREWGARTGAGWVLRFSTRMYRLGTLARPDGVAGRGRPATEPDVPLIAEWAEAFHDEAQPFHPVDDWAAWAAGRVDTGQLFIWEDDRGAPVSLAGRTPVANGVARVGPVYTPPEARAHGYGSAVTALATEAALDDGAADVVLYTDLANPVSNSIYQRIGYEALFDSEERDFTPA